MREMVALDDSGGSFYALQWALDNIINGVTPTNEPSQEFGMVILVHVQYPFQPTIYPVSPGAVIFFIFSFSLA